MSSSRDPRQSLLWFVIRRHLESGHGSEAALFSGGAAVSYAGLAGAVARGAALLDERFPKGTRVAIAGRNQLDVGVALLAALESHVTPLLVDPASPERLVGLLAPWRVAGAIGDGALLEGLRVPVVDSNVVAGWRGERASGRDFLPRAVAADEPAFWTFTSGTTGEPQAVVHAHRGPRAAFEGFGADVLALGPEDVTISTAGLPFVYALGNNFFFPLMAGAAAILPADLLLPTVLGELARHGATVLVSGPWSLEGIVRLTARPAWVRALRNLRLVLSAGESLPASVFREWKTKLGKEPLDNLGATEMFNSFLGNFPGDAREGSVGRPVAGFEIRVAGKAWLPGARGMLAVRGDSRAVALGRGGELAPVTGDWCETGDDVEVGREGRFVFLGRRDDRFKVRGRFVHPLEVERCLREADGVRECLVVPDVDEHGLAVAVAKIVPEPGVEERDLTRRLARLVRSRLEPFEVPGRFDVVPSLPRNDRGKLDRRRLVS